MSSISNTGWAEITGTAATGGYSNEYRIVVNGQTGTQTVVSLPSYSEDDWKSKGDVDTKPDTAKPTPKRISPKLYFTYVKSKLQKNELRELKTRLGRLQTLTKDAFDIGQKGLFEEYAKSLVMAVRESEAVVCGFDRFVERKDIEKFQSIAKETNAYKSPVYFKTLEEFPRSVPSQVKTKIQSVKQKGIFDSLHVLYLDYTHEEVKTNKEKIREKDPVLFGQFSYDKNKFFYITDWTDEYCDLTLKEFVSKLRTDDPHYLINHVPDIDNSFIRKMRKEVDERQVRLESTKASNYRSLMSEEDKANKKPWYKRLFRKS